MDSGNDTLPSVEQLTTTISRHRTLLSGIRMAFMVGAIVSIVAVEPVLAQSTGTAFCNSNLAETVKNIFTIIQYGGPLVGGVIALGATVAIPMVRRADIKKEMKELRNQGIIWGVLVAPLGTAIVAFLLNNVVVGGASCGF